MPPNRLIRLIAISIGLILSDSASAQSPLRVESESRDAAAAFIDTHYFMIGRIGRDCMPVLGRSQTPQQFVQAWQRRNAKYYVSAIKYMKQRLDEAQAEGGTAKRDAVLALYTSNIQGNGDAAAKDWLARGEPKQACQQAVATVESGAADITSRIRMFAELEALAAWTQLH